MMRQGDINDVDKKGRGKKSYSIVVVVRMGKEIGTVREGIGPS